MVKPGRFMKAKAISKALLHGLYCVKITQLLEASPISTKMRTHACICSPKDLLKYVRADRRLGRMSKKIEDERSVINKEFGYLHN